MLELGRHLVVDTQALSRRQKRGLQGTGALGERGVAHLHGRGSAHGVAHGNHFDASAIQGFHGGDIRPAYIETRCVVLAWRTADDPAVDEPAACILDDRRHGRAGLRRHGVAVREGHLLAHTANRVRHAARNLGRPRGDEDGEDEIRGLHERLQVGHLPKAVRRRILARLVAPALQTRDHVQTVAVQRVADGPAHLSWT